MKPVLDTFDEFELSDGTKFYAHGHVLGLAADDNQLFYGYDGSCGPYGDDPYGGFSVEQRREIAEYMIETWKKWGGLA